MRHEAPARSDVTRGKQPVVSASAPVTTQISGSEGLSYKRYPAARKLHELFRRSSGATHNWKKFRLDSYSVTCLLFVMSRISEAYIYVACLHISVALYLLRDGRGNTLYILHCFMSILLPWPRMRLLIQKTNQSTWIANYCDKKKTGKPSKRKKNYSHHKADAL